MNQKKIGTLLVYFKMIISIIISFIYTPYMLMTLGKSEYGAISIASSMISYLNLIGLGVSSSYVRFNIRVRKKGDREEEYTLNGIYFLLFLVMGIITLIAGIVLVKNAEYVLGDKILPEEYKIVKRLMLICVINMAVSFPGGLFRMMLNAYEKFFFISATEFIATVLQPAVCFMLLLHGHRSIALQVTAMLLSFLQFFLNATYAFHILKLRIVFRRYKLKYIKEIFAFSSFIFLNQIVNTINWNVDNYLTAIFIGTTGTAVYAFGYQFQNYYMTLSTTIANVFAPQLNKLIYDKKMNQINECFCRIGRLQAILLMFVFGVFLNIGKSFVLVFTGSSDYIPSFYVAVILMASTIIPLSQNLGIEIQRAMNKHKFRSVLYMGIAVLNLLVSIPLCKKYGAIGCALGTAFGQIIGNIIIMNIYYQKKIGINVLKYYIEILKVLPSVILAFIICSVGKYFVFIPVTKIGFLSSAVIVSCIYIIVIWMLGLNKYEKQLLIGIIKR